MGSSNAASTDGMESIPMGGEQDWHLEVEQTSAGWKLRVLPPPASPVHAHSTWHPPARSQLSFWCKTTCTSKCFWPSVRHRQHFPTALISLTLIYFKILHRLKKKIQPTISYSAGPHLKAHQGEERPVLTPVDPALLPHRANLFIRRQHRETLQDTHPSPCQTL